MAEWGVYRGDGLVHDEVKLPEPPPWRRFDGAPEMTPPPAAADSALSHRRAANYQATAESVDMVNAALTLRRPLLVTGRPGTGKSSLAFNVARELGLGPVLSWPITSRSTLTDALYNYDAIGRLQEANIYAARRDAEVSGEPDIGRFIRLGPFGTALLPWRRPRVLLIDEFDKSDIDLPNDLLHVMETGEFEIPQLIRDRSQTPEVQVMTSDRTLATVIDGRVRCAEFPFIVITSNGERPFPPAFLRRCLQLYMVEPDAHQLSRIVAAHLGRDEADGQSRLLDDFLDIRSRHSLATDQLLNAMYLALQQNGGDGRFEDVLNRLLTPLDEAR